MTKSIKTINEFIEANQLEEKIQVNESGVTTVPSDLFEQIVLMDAGITADQYKKLEEGSEKLMLATDMVVANKAQEIFKANPEIGEVGFNYLMGTHTTVSGVIQRKVEAEANNLINRVETVYDSAAFHAVHKAVNRLMDEVND